MFKWISLSRSRSVIIGGFAVLAIPMVLGQSNAKLPEFDVVSIKPADPKGMLGIGLYTYPGGRIVGSQCTVKLLLIVAFNVQGFQILGGPHWIDEDSYDVEAKPPTSSASIRSNPASFKSPPNEEQRQMLQALMIDRFHLEIHREIREGAVYVLEKTEKPLKLNAPSDMTAYPWAGSPEGGVVGRNSGLAGINISMPQLVARLSGFVGRPVLDQTGVEGSFDFEYKTGDDDPAGDATTTVQTSLQHLGLRLRSTRGPIEYIVVDRIERPTVN